MNKTTESKNDDCEFAKVILYLKYNPILKFPLQLT